MPKCSTASACSSKTPPRCCRLVQWKGRGDVLACIQCQTQQQKHWCFGAQARRPSQSRRRRCSWLQSLQRRAEWSSSAHLEDVLQVRVVGGKAVVRAGGLGEQQPHRVALVPEGGLQRCTRNVKHLPTCHSGVTHSRSRPVDWQTLVAAVPGASAQPGTRVGTAAAGSCSVDCRCGQHARRLGNRRTCTPMKMLPKWRPYTSSSCPLVFRLPAGHSERQ